MLRLLAVCILLTVALSKAVDSDFDWKNILKEQGFSEEDIEGFAQDEREAKVELEQEEAEEEDDITWDEAKGYGECEEFMWWKKGGKEEWKEDDWADKKKEWAANNEMDDEEDKDNDYEVDQYKFGGNKKKGKSCPKPKSLAEACKDNECPPFEKVDVSGCGFEARKILSANWVVTNLDVSDMKKGDHSAFWRLFKYISGANDQGAKIAMTVPVITKWYMDDDYEVLGAEMAFYIPSAFQANPPAPTDDQVRVENWDDAITYDRAFGGDREDEEIYVKQFKMLYKALAKEGITPYSQMSITAGYTRPGWGRQRKEVMLVDAGSM